MDHEFNTSVRKNIHWHAVTNIGIALHGPDYLNEGPEAIYYFIFAVLHKGKSVAIQFNDIFNIDILMRELPKIPWDFKSTVASG